MKATEILTSEHRVIERVISSIEITTDRLENGQAVRPGFFIDVAGFIKGFADGCHHVKEEQVLFNIMESSGVPVDGQIGVMLADHAQGRSFTRGMLESAAMLAAGDASARGPLIRYARGYTRLLRQHIQKEDNILFPLADRSIPIVDHDKVFEGFEKVEHEETGEGVHEKYLGLAEKLENEAGLN